MRTLHVCIASLFVSLFASLFAPLFASAASAAEPAVDLEGELYTRTGAPSVITLYEADALPLRPGSHTLRAANGSSLGTLSVFKDGTAQVSGASTEQVAARLSGGTRSGSSSLIIITVELGSYDDGDCEYTFYADIDPVFGEITLYGTSVCEGVTFE